MGSDAHHTTVAVRASVLLAHQLTGSPAHLVRLEKERWGNREAEGLGGLEVDDQFELRHVITRAIVEVGAITKLSAVR